MSGVLVLGISHCQVIAGEAKIKPYSVKTNAIYNEINKNIKNIKADGTVFPPIYSNKVNRKETYQIGIDNGTRFGAGDYNRLTIHQTKNPCLFIDKEDWELDHFIKVDTKTIRMESAKGNAKRGTIHVYNYLNTKTRPSLGHNLVFHNNGKITNKLDGREVMQVLGTDKNCYLHPTVEEWTFFNKNRSGDFKEVGRVKFYLR